MSPSNTTPSPRPLALSASTTISSATGTDQAIGILADLDEPLLALHGRLLGHLSQAELKELIRLLEKVRETLTIDD